MTQSRKLKEMSWTVFEEYKKHTNLVIIPVGAIEVYGPICRSVRIVCSQISLPNL
ncbi:hypothetical protein [Paenibacillus sp. DCT19]|uniref:hypothetical protein n=1 Tax=Paenibacillus sp. DCT19 TaxID=2211212 RepID=UPI0013E292AF|nr:hypothetical protein [Paenibacillus sp. DCT19]